MDPFNLKSALLAKHAQHVVLIHFPIALFLAGTGFDIAARWMRQSANRTTMMAAARINIIAAAVFVAPTILSGVLAWQWALQGAPLKGLLKLHLILGTTAGSLICLTAWLHFRQGTISHRYLLSLEVFTAAILGLAAHIGGFLSGVNLA